MRFPRDALVHDTKWKASRRQRSRGRRAYGSVPAQMLRRHFEGGGAVSKQSIIGRDARSRVTLRTDLEEATQSAVDSERGRAPRFTLPYPSSFSPWGADGGVGGERNAWSVAGTASPLALADFDMATSSAGWSAAASIESGTQHMSDGVCRITSRRNL